ncbi:hypothetical protein [Brachybacterium sp. GPGPB12]
MVALAPRRPLLAGLIAIVVVAVVFSVLAAAGPAHGVVRLISPANGVSAA